MTMKNKQDSKPPAIPPLSSSDLLGGMLDSMQAHGNLLPDERRAIEKTISSGEQYGFGNLMAWLATAWALRLRDCHGLPEKVAIEAVSGRTPYPLPPNTVLGDTTAK